MFIQLSKSFYFYLINIVNIEILSLKFFSKTTYFQSTELTVASVCSSAQLVNPASKGALDQDGLTGCIYNT